VKKYRKEGLISRRNQIRKCFLRIRYDLHYVGSETAQGTAITVTKLPLATLEALLNVVGFGIWRALSERKIRLPASSEEKFATLC
jgi:hypothetical protein